MRPVEGLNTHVHNHSIWHKAVQLVNIKYTISHCGLKLKFPSKGTYTVLTRAVNNNDGADHAGWDPTYDSWAVFPPPKNSYNEYLFYWDPFLAHISSFVYLFSSTLQSFYKPTLPHLCTLNPSLPLPLGHCPVLQDPCLWFPLLLHLLGEYKLPK